MGADMTKEEWDELKAKVQEKVNEKKMVMFTKAGCPYCSKAKEVGRGLVKEGVLEESDIMEIRIDQHPQGSAIMEYMNELTGASTVPRVFINGKFYSGGSGLEEKYWAGELHYHIKPDFQPPENWDKGPHQTGWWAWLWCCC